MKYFYDYFARQYRESRAGKLFPDPTAMYGNIGHEDIQSCRWMLKNAYAGYREGRNAEALKRLLGEYREYVSCCHDRLAKDRYNAFVYRYMVEARVSCRTIAAKLGAEKKTVVNYINRCIDEMLVLCMGIPAAGNPPGDREGAVRMLTDGSRLFRSMAGDYAHCLFSGERERAAAGSGRQATRDVMERFADAVAAYSGYCNDEHARIDTDIRKAEILERCIEGIPPAAIAKIYGCCEGTVYADIRKNEKRLAAMMFDLEGGTADGSKSKG